MPLTTLDPIRTDTPLPAAFMRMSQEQRAQMIGGDRLAPTPTHGSDRGDRPGIGQVWAAASHQTIMQGIADAFMRPTMDQTTGPADFNPFEYIDANGLVEREPRIAHLVERGQFDHSMTIEQFEHDLSIGLRMLDAVDTHQKSTWTQYLTVMAAQMVGDPGNLIPLGAGLNLARKGMTLSRAAMLSSGMAAFTLGHKKSIDALNPAANEPGFTDEAMAAGFGATLGAITAGVMSPPVRSGATAFLDHRTAQRIQKRVKAVWDEPLAKFRDQGATTTGMKSAETRRPPLTDVTLREQYEADNKTLLQMLDEEPTDEATVSVLHQPGDENGVQLDALRAKYEEAGKRLHVVQHPDQHIYDIVTEGQALVDEFNLNTEASLGELGASLGDRIAQEVTSRYANAQSAVTSGGRIAQSNLGVVNDAYRTLAGSARTITRGSALDPFNHASGAPAEGLKGLISNDKDMAIVRIRQLSNASLSLKRRDPITYRGQEVGGLFKGDSFYKAVGDYRMRLQDQANGHRVDMPDDVHPNIKRAAELSQRYFGEMRNLMEYTGMLAVGPRALARAKSELEDIDVRLGELDEQIARNKSFAADKSELFGSASYSGQEVLARLRSFRDTINEASPLAQADAALEAQAGDADGFTAQQVGIHPDDLERMTPAQRRRAQASGRISEDDAVSAREQLGDQLYEQAVDEIVNGKRQIKDLIDDILDAPDQYDPDLVLDAILARRFREADPDARQTIRDLIDPQDIPENTVIRVLGEEWTVKLDEEGYKVVETPDIILNADEMTALPVDRASLEGLNVPAASKAKKAAGRLANRKRRLERKRGRQADAVAGLEKAVARQADFMPVVFDTEAIMANPDGFVARLADEFLANDLRVADGDLDALPLSKQLIGDGKLDRRALEEIAILKDDTSMFGDDAPDVDALIDDLTVGDLPPEMRERYTAELNSYYQRNARAVFENITNPYERHGVPDAIGQISNPLKKRIMDIRRSEMADFLDMNIESVMERYHRTVGGHAAVRRAIQLNPEAWRGRTLRDGTAVTDADTMAAYLKERTGILKQFAAIADRSGDKPLSPKVQRWATRIERDILKPMDFLVGRNPFHGPANDAFSTIASMGRTALRVSYLNKLGSVLWAQINDLAPVSLYMMQRPQTIRHLAGAFRSMDNIPDLLRRDLEALALVVDDITRTRAISDRDELLTQIQGRGPVAAIAGRIEKASGDLSDAHARVTGMDYITNVNKRISGFLVTDRLSNNSKRLLRAQALMDGGMDQAQALRRVGLSRFDAQTVNRLGLNTDRARMYHDHVYRYGLTKNGRAIHEAMSFDDYLKSNDVFIPNFMDWPLADDRARDLFDLIRANINAEVNQSMVVTPGAFDRPIINFSLWGRIFNQFQTFGMAFVNQRLRVMGQMPAKYQAWYAMSYLALGALSDGISNHLSGRRSFAETGQLWTEQPLAMTYAAFDRSGLAGWLSRPLNIAEAMGIPLAPGNLLSESNTASAHVQQGKMLTYFGPAASDIDRLAGVISDLGSFNANRGTAYQAWKLLPFQNLMWLRMVNSFTGLPVTPQSLMRDKMNQRKKREGPQP